MAVLLLVIRPFSFIYLFITYYVKLRLLLFNIGFLTLLLVQTCTDHVSMTLVIISLEN